MSSATSESSWRWERAPGAVWTLWFDQPGRTHNLLDPSTLDDLEARLFEIEADSSVKGLVIKSAKPGGFCAGVDLETIQSFTTAGEVEAFVVRGLAVFDHLSRLAVPTVAVVHGVCLGGGFELALACRRRVALASQAPLQMGLPEVQQGLIPAWGGNYQTSPTHRSRERLGPAHLGPVDRLSSGSVARHRRPARRRRGIRGMLSS